MDELLSFLAERDPTTAFYADKLRASMFSGFLTLAGFMFTVKTFLILRLQQDVYSDESYQNWVHDVGRTYNPEISVYGSLKRLGRLFFITVCACFAAAVAQLTLGLAEQRWATWLAIVIAVGAACLFLGTLIVVRNVVRSWVEFQEKKCDKRLKERAAAADKTEDDA